MADDETDDTSEETEETTDEKDKPDTDADDDSDEESGEDDRAKKDPELEKAIKRRDRAIAETRRLKAELAKRDEKKDEEPDPEAVANTKIVRTAAHGILRGLGIEDKEDRIEVLDMLRLDDIDVDSDGADEDAIEERIDKLREILGSGKKTAARVPRTVKTQRETKDTNTDPDKARYRRIMSGR